MLFDMKEKNEMSFLYDVKILILRCPLPLQNMNGADDMTQRH